MKSGDKKCLELRKKNTATKYTVKLRENMSFIEYHNGKT